MEGRTRTRSQRSLLVRWRDGHSSAKRDPEKFGIWDRPSYSSFLEAVEVSEAVLRPDSDREERSFPERTRGSRSPDH